MYETRSYYFLNVTFSQVAMPKDSLSPSFLDQASKLDQSAYSDQPVYPQNHPSHDISRSDFLLPPHQYQAQSIDVIHGHHSTYHPHSTAVLLQGLVFPLEMLSDHPLPTPLAIMECQPYPSPVRHLEAGRTHYEVFCSSSSCTVCSSCCITQSLMALSDIFSFGTSPRSISTRPILTYALLFLPA